MLELTLGRTLGPTLGRIATDRHRGIGRSPFWLVAAVVIVRP